MRSITFTLFIILSLSATAQDELLEVYHKTFENASNSDRNVILVFGHQHCGWCRVLEDYHRDSEVAEILNKYFIINKVDILESETGKLLYEQFELPGTPAWIIFSPKRKILSDGKDHSGKMIGYPYKPSEIEAYQEILTENASVIGSNELKKLGNKLKYYGDLKYEKKNQNDS